MFKPHTWQNQSEPWELQPVKNGLALEPGVAMAYSGGVLVKAAGTIMPTHICMEKVDATETNQMIHVERVRPETEYATELSVQSTSIAVGAKYTIDANGEKITATAEGGVATVTGFEGTAAGSKVYVRFA
jgi:hypothetical protein